MNCSRFIGKAIIHNYDNNICQYSPVSNTKDRREISFRKDPQYEKAVKASFVFLKENLDFNSMVDQIIQGGLLQDREKEDYVCKFHNYFRIDKLIKLMIKKNRCAEFVNIISQMDCYPHVIEHIEKVRQKAETGNNQRGARGIDESKNTDIYEALQNKVSYIYMNEEPREIADKMLQAGLISVAQHDDVADFSTKYQRLEKLFEILKSKLSFSSFVDMVHLFEEKTGPTPAFKCRYALCMRQNFTLLQNELPCARVLMEYICIILDDTLSSDIEAISGEIRQKSKLLKILMMDKTLPCKGFLRVIKRYVGREDLVRRMKNNSFDMQQRGKPNLDARFEGLNISCLDEHQKQLEEMLEPLDLSDVLFEVGALDFLEHDRITEDECRKNQVIHLLNVLTEDKNDCFYWFQWCLKEENNNSIIELLRSASESLLTEPESSETELSAIHTVTRMADHVQNEVLAVALSSSPNVEETIYQGYNISATEMEEVTASEAEMTIDKTLLGSVVFQLRPLTDQAAQNLLDAKTNNKLVKMVCGILKQVKIPEMTSGSKPLEIKVQVCYARSTKPNEDFRHSKACKIKACRRYLVSSIDEPKKLMSMLSRSATFPRDKLKEINVAPNHQRVEKLLSFVEQASSAVMDDFLSALRDSGYHEQEELINSTKTHDKAENIRKMITSNYKCILDEMQLKLARETLSCCIGNVSQIKEDILPKNGSRRDRMNKFIQFILKDDFNVIMFEKMMRNNGIEKFLKMNDGHSQDIDVTFVDEHTLVSPLDEILFESIITISQTGRDPPDLASVYMMFPEIPEGRIEPRTCEKSNNSNQPLDGSDSRPNSAKQVVLIDGLVANTMTSKKINSHVNLSHCSRCQGDTEYYCLTCEQNLCPACKIKHSINLDTKEHDTRLYKYKNTIPRTREPCKNHPNQDYEMYCKKCDIPFCVDCEDHEAHSVQDAMTVYKEHEEIINNISEDTLYTFPVLLAIIKLELTTCNKKVTLILSEMIKELQKVKDHLDTLSIDAFIKFHLHKISQNLTAAMNKRLSKIKIFDANQHKFVNKPTKFLRAIDKIRFLHIDITPLRKQRCSLTVTKMDLRGLNMLLNNIQHTKRGKHMIRSEDLLKLMSVPDLQKSTTLKNFVSCQNVSCVTRDQAWISERNKLVLIDIPTGNILHTLNDVVDGWWWGLHSVNINRELFYISNDSSIIKLSIDRKIASKVLTARDLLVRARSVYCTRSTGDLLVGIKIFNSYKKEINGVVVRFNNMGQPIMIIPEHYKHHALFKDPNYITENNNGDVVVSDYWRGVVVTDHKGKHRFTYIDTPFGSRIMPRGICTDALSNILVCDCYTGKVLILDKEGKYLLNIPTDLSLGPLGKPCSLSYDWKTHTLWVGSWNNTVSRYRHIDRRFVLSDNREICINFNSEVSRCFNNPWNLKELDSAASVCRRRLEKTIKSTGEPISLTDYIVHTVEFMNETLDEFFKAATLRALKYHISMEKAFLDLGKGFLFKIIAVIHAILIDIIIKTPGLIVNEVRMCLLEMEGYLLKVGQKVNNMDLKHVIKRILEDNDTFLKVKELLKERMDTFEKTMNKFNEKEFPDQAKDIFHLVMDVLSIFNQAEEPTEFQQAAEKE
uniref:Uncharacterized protein LOC111112774 isoform X3 n=1 Tax=Crassostrea virginica TaxID=6565 RepID=A0A8B8BTT2_CRAVI|nr:uncharacterized protein LOC111112774 isoform X3 [Crassostrea virginica]